MKTVAGKWISLGVALAFLLLSIPCVPAEEPSSPENAILHVRKLSDGRWIGWTDSRNQRTRVNIPQSQEAIFAFARKYQLRIEFHGEAGDATPDVNEPLVVPASGSALPRTAPVERAAPPLVESTPAPASSVAQAPVATPSAPVSAVVRPVSGSAATDAEQVTKLESAIQTSEARIEELKQLFANPEGEFQKAQAEFKEIGARLEKQKAEVERLKNAGDGTDFTAAENEVQALEKKWGLARERFNLAIMTQKTQQEQIAALQEKVRQDRLALEKLLGPKTPPVEDPMTRVDSPIGGNSPTNAVAGTASAPGPTAGNVKPTPNVPSPLLPPAMPPVQHASGEAASASAPGEKPPAEAAASATEAPVNARLAKAQLQAEIKKEAAREAELEAQSLTERLVAVDKNLSLEQKLYDAARRKSDIAFQQRKTLQEEYQTKSVDGTPREEMQRLTRNLKKAEDLFHEARQEVAAHMDRLRELQDERTQLQAEEVAALTAAQQKTTEAQKAEGKVSELKNPYSIQNLSQWLLDHGLKIALILFVMYALRWMVKLGNRRIVSLMIHTGHGTQEEREDRASTLMGVFHNAATMAISIGGALMIFEEVGVPVATLMGSAAILGLAVAFGAQNLIRDYFYGFVILLENQYKINDVLKIGDISGQVERITLRMTVLRDLEGRVHFIPNGKIDSVTNMTHGWSRAVFEIGVAYKEDCDRVMGVLMEVARGLKRDPKFAMLILDEPEMLGVDAFSDSAVVIKFFIKTRPLRQWQVKREMLRRIKRHFDELGIEIPFPHRTIYHANSQAASASSPSAHVEDDQQDAA